MKVLSFQITDAASEDHVVFLYGVTSEGERVIVRDVTLPLHFLITYDDIVNVEDLQYQIDGLALIENKLECRVVKTKIIEKKLLGEKTKFIKVFVNNKKALKVISKAVYEFEGVRKVYERDIPHYKKYMFDKKITPLTTVRAEGDLLTNPPTVEYYMEAQEVKIVENELIDYKILAFDIETYNPNTISDAEKHPILMISYAASTGNSGVLTWKENKEKFAKNCIDERGMIKEFLKIIREENPAFIITYNGDNFDFPYLRKRARKNKLKLNIGWDGGKVRFRRKGIRGLSAKCNGLVHLDLYPFIATSMGTYLKTDTYTLNDVCNELLGEEKEDFDINKLAKKWDNDDINQPLCYSLQDAEVTMKLSKKVLPLLFELSRIVGVIPFNVARMGFSKLVENFLMRETRNFKEVIVRKPTREEVGERFKRTYKGGFVVEPKPGFHENIAVFDFRSLYPTIIVAHNICPTTLNAKGRDVHVSPKIEVNKELQSFRFAKKPIGFIPTLIKGLIERRIDIKKILKELDKSDEDYSILSARQNAVKLLTNASYGYLGFPQARWYSMECAASITAWGRQYINNVIKRAKKAGLIVLYGDTDSCFFILPKPDVNAALKFANKVNASLPSIMELQFEGFFKTGIFVTLKGGKRGAKKKYALCDEKNELTIKGFELVRRDWSELAKKLQKKMLDKILINKDFKGALELLNETINKMKRGEYPIKDFVIRTRLTKDVKNYESINPHVSAALKAEKNGKKIVAGMMINYVITKGTGSISDRSYLETEVISKGLIPDFEYYINNQLIPSVEEILKTIGFKESEIIIKEQKKLTRFM